MTFPPRVVVWAVGVSATPVIVKLASGAVSPTLDPKLTAPLPEVTVKACTPAVVASTVDPKVTPLLFAVVRTVAPPKVTAP